MKPADVTVSRAFVAVSIASLVIDSFVCWFYIVILTVNLYSRIVVIWYRVFN